MIREALLVILFRKITSKMLKKKRKTKKKIRLLKMQLKSTTQPKILQVRDRSKSKPSQAMPVLGGACTLTAASRAQLLAEPESRPVY